MKKHIVCIGDSNTHGYCADPSDCADGGVRFNENERWTCLLQKKLGDDFLVIEEGLGDRTTVFDDPLIEGSAAINYITPCLKSHRCVDFLIIMLGTNDTKDRFAASGECIGMGMARLVKKAMDTDCWGGKRPKILVVSPPVIGEGVFTSSVIGRLGTGSVEKSKELAKEYKQKCDLLGIHFLDAEQAGCELNQIDYVHLTRKGHATLADALAKLVPTLL